MQAVVDNNLTKVASLIKDAKKFGLEEELVNIPDKDGTTPLMQASIKNNLHIGKLLIEAGSIVSKKNNVGNTAAHLAAANGSNDVLRLLLIRGVNVDERDQYNFTLLHKAAKLNNHLTVDMLLNEFDGRSFINDNSNDLQVTPLTYAIWYKGDLEMVEILIRAGANKEKVDWDNKTTLNRAKEERKMDIVNYLVNLEDKKLLQAVVDDDLPKVKSECLKLFNKGCQKIRH